MQGIRNPNGPLVCSFGPFSFLPLELTANNNRALHLHRISLSSQGGIFNLRHLCHALLCFVSWVTAKCSSAFSFPVLYFFSSTLLLILTAVNINCIEHWVIIKPFHRRRVGERRMYWNQRVHEALASFLIRSPFLLSNKLHIPSSDLMSFAKPVFCNIPCYLQFIL